MAEANIQTISAKCKVQFSGGLEMYFNNEREIQLEFSHAQDAQWTIRDLIEKLRVGHMSDKEEMFVANGTVRPGIIVLINDTDWELMDTNDYPIENNDIIAFISTLHGG